MDNLQYVCGPNVLNGISCISYEWMFYMSGYEGCYYCLFKLSYTHTIKYNHTELYYTLCSFQFKVVIVLERPIDQEQNRMITYAGNRNRNEFVGFT